MLQSLGTVCVISDGILLYGYISMDGHIIPGEVNMAVRDTSARSLSTSYTFFSPLHAKTFPVIGKKWKLDLSLLLGPQECSMIFLVLRHLQLAETYNWKRK